MSASAPPGAGVSRGVGGRGQQQPPLWVCEGQQGSAVWLQLSFGEVGTAASSHMHAQHQKGARHALGSPQDLHSPPTTHLSAPRTPLHPLSPLHPIRSAPRSHIAQHRAADQSLGAVPRAWTQPPSSPPLPHRCPSPQPHTPTAPRATQCPTWKAYFPRVLTTSLKGILEVKVWPWYTMGSPFGPSQQSTSRQRQPRFRALWVGSHPSTPARAPAPCPPSGCGVTPAEPGDMCQGEDTHLGMDGGREGRTDGFREGKTGHSISKRDPPPGRSCGTGGAGGQMGGSSPLPDVAFDAALTPDLVLYQVGVVRGGDEVVAERLGHVLPQSPVLRIEDGALRGAEVHEEPVSTQRVASPGCGQTRRRNQSQGRGGRGRSKRDCW